ncbi:DNA polymerase delta subunit 3 isoform X2 [Spea bombifrons]|uniref:DNA polymerase delta subunit 3 isoform X2 n=1 Tax=Spea bombifrons TaxID=233779 RepID=UPI0023490D67|nr:DNA polymerase delta subunit 3 isoform X2 [Spea bombifrons]
MDELYLENIDELVTDQNKIVTYKWLSLTLGVHVNQAKQMLYDYVTRKRKENQSAQVHVTYLLTGKCIQNGYPYHKVAVVREDKLEAAKAKLAVVANVHVYSIQKAALKDSAPLFNTDYDIFKNNLEDCNKFSAIRCPQAVPRTPEQMSQSQPVEQAPTPSTPAINGHLSQPAAKSGSQPPKGIMGMFTRPPSKTQQADKETKPESKEPEPSAGSNKPSAKASAMNNFFGKASLSKIKETSSTNESVKQEEKPSPSVAPTTAAPPPEKPAKKSEAAKAPAKEKKRLKRAEISDSDEEAEKLVKKRRRIKQPTRDSSDEEGAPPSRQVKTPSPPLPPEPVQKSEAESQSQSGGKRRKRKRVLKSRTFVDDEGCMVTEKAYVSESCTDSGEDFSTTSKPAAAPRQPSAAAVKQEAKAETKSSKKTSAASKGTKQASIMGFFQKK